MSRFSAWLATGRVSNLPTVWSHVLTGAILGNWGTFPGAAGFVWQLAAVMALGSSFYVGGCFLGDANDADFDAKFRPERPIPSGILSENSVRFTAWALLLGAWLLAPLLLPTATYHRLGLDLSDVAGALRDGTLLRLPLIHQLLTSTLLLLAIVLYAKWHKRLPLLGLILMGSCRGLLILWAASMASLDERAANAGFDWSFLNPGVLAAAATSAFFTIGFVLVARTESQPDQPVPAFAVRGILIVVPLVGFLVAWNVLAPSISWLTSVAVALYLIWIGAAFRLLPRSKPAFVARCLAGFSLLDAAFLSLSGPAPALFAAAAFLFALLLQRVAPAT